MGRWEGKKGTASVAGPGHAREGMGSRSRSLDDATCQSVGEETVARQE